MKHVHSHSVVDVFQVFFLRDVADLRFRFRFRLILNLILFDFFLLKMRHVHSHSVVYKFLVFFLRDLDDLRLKLKIILNLIDFTQLLAIYLSQLSNSAVFVHLVV